MRKFFLAWWLSLLIFALTSWVLPITEVRANSSSSLKFLVVADYHIDLNSYAYLDRIRTWQDQLYQLAVDRAVDFVFIMGDFVQDYGGSTSVWQNWTLEMNSRQQILTFQLQGDHEHFKGKHVNFTRITNLPPFYAFSIKGINFMSYGSWRTKHIAPDEFKAFAEYQLNRTSGTTILLTQNAIYNTTTPEDNDFGSLADNHWYIDEDWWQNIIQNHIIPLYIHGNNHADFNNRSQTIVGTRWGATHIPLSAMFKGQEYPPHAVMVEITASSIIVSSVNLETLSESTLTSLDTSTSLSTNAASNFTIGGRISNNQTEKVYNHYIASSVTYEIAGDPYEGELAQFRPFNWTFGDSGGSSEYGGKDPVPHELTRTRGTKFQWQWNGTYPNKELIIDNEYETAGYTNLYSPRENEAGANGIIELGGGTKFDVIVKAKANNTSVRIRTGMRFYDGSGGETNDQTEWTNMTTTYYNYTHTATSPSDATNGILFVSLQSSGRISISQFSIKVDEASGAQTQDAYLSLNGTQYGQRGTLAPFEYNSYSLNNRWERYNLEAGILGCRVALWRMVFNDFEGFALHNSIKYNGSSWDVSYDRNPWTNVTRLFFLADEPRVNVIYGQVTGFEVPRFSDGKLTFAVSAPSGTTTTAKVYCGSLGEPHAVSGATSYSYDSLSRILTVTVTHSSMQDVKLEWMGVPQPQANAGSDHTVYAYDQVNFDGSASTASLGFSLAKFQWDFENDGIFDAEGEKTSYTYTEEGEYTAVLKVTDSSGESDTDTVTIIVLNRAPEASFSYSPSEPTIRDIISFNDTSSDKDGRVNSWSWGFGDGTTSDLQSSTHQYSDKGTFSVTLTVTDNDGATNSITKTVTVYNLEPVAGFSYSPTSLTVGEEIQFTDESEDPEEKLSLWVWDFGDGSTSTVGNPTHKYESAGAYTVKLTVTDDEGANNLISHTVTVKEKPFFEQPSPEQHDGIMLWGILLVILVVGIIIAVLGMFITKKRKTT